MTIGIDIELHRSEFSLRAKFVAPAGVTVLFGPSGCGKTTMLNSVAGLIRPDVGKLRIGDQLVFGPGINIAPHKRRVGYVFQQPRLFPHLDVAGNLDFASRLGAVVPAVNRRNIVDLLEIGPLMARFPAALSGGQAQRVALGRALLSDPACLCMDEPLSALDAELKQRILPFIERLRDTTSIPILYVTHDASEMGRLADHIVLMKDGNTVMSGDTAAILADPASASFLGVRDPGTVVPISVGRHDPNTGLTQVTFDGGSLILPDVNRPQGKKIRLRIAAQDIILATHKPVGLSALNILEGIITQVHQNDGRGAMVQFQVGATKFLARVTRHSVQKMQLAAGKTVYAIVKATAFDPAGVGT